MLVIWTLWNNMCLRRQLEAERTEGARLQKAMGKKSDSIWKMDKADLVEKARLDLGMTKAQAEKETVTALRERLRSQKEVMEAMDDPMTTIPKGLDSMNKAALTAECMMRGIPIVDPSTRPKMIVAIRDDVANRLVMIHQPSEWEMTDAPKSSENKRKV